MSAFERHWSINKIAEAWGVSPGVVRELFRDRADVIRIERPETRNKRGYTTLRIPESVVERVHAELRQKRGSR